MTGVDLVLNSDLLARAQTEFKARRGPDQGRHSGAALCPYALGCSSCAISGSFSATIRQNSSSR